MSIEDQIREKHRREDEERQLAESRALQLETFRSALPHIHEFARALSGRELEVVMARLADRISESQDEAIRFSYRIKGMILKKEFDLRSAGATDLDTKQFLVFESANEWEFKWKHESTGDYICRNLLRFSVPLPVPEEHLSKWLRSFGSAEVENCIIKFYKIGPSS